jgi:predicted nucleotidyltransferase
MEGFHRTPSVEQVKQAILSLGEELAGAEAVGICGSLARGWDFDEHSDIDIFVVVRDKAPRGETDRHWWRLMQRALRPFGRDISVLVYTLKGLRSVSNWYVLRLASEGLLIFDQGQVTQLFQDIVRAAEAAGLVQERIGDAWVWTAKGIKPGEVIEVTVS